MIKVFATICALTTGDCHEVMITNSDLAEQGLTMTACMTGLAVTDWMREHPGHRLASWKCEIGDRNKSDKRSNT